LNNLRQCRRKSEPSLASNPGGVEQVCWMAYLNICSLSESRRIKMKSRMVNDQSEDPP
jgi:hypothetical protein